MVFRSICAIFARKSVRDSAAPRQLEHVPLRSVCTSLVTRTKHVRIMTTVELNAQIWRDMAEIADSEQLMKQLAKYLKKVVAKKSDPTLMTKEEFFAKLDEAEREIAEGKGIKMLPNESLDEFLRRIG